MSRRLRAPALLLLAAAPGAQMAGSPSYALDGLRLEGPARGVASPGHAGLFGVESALAGELSSPAFKAELGLLRAFDPLASDGPAIFAVSPAHGPVAGGTQVTIAGLHLGGALAASVGGVPLTGLTPVSDTTLSGVAPPGFFGPKAVQVVTAQGSTTQGGAYAYSPAVTASPIAWQTGELILSNLGPPGALFQTWYSTAATSIPLPPFGTLLIGPAPLVPAITDGVYPAPDGVHVVHVPVPALASLAGATLHFQSLAVLSLAPLEVQLVNRASTLFH